MSDMSLKFKKIVVLDRIILLERQWDELRSMAETLIQYSGLAPEDIVKRLDAEADASEAPMCWTQLAKEEMTLEELFSRVCDADAIITCWTNIPDELIMRCPRLRYLGFWTNLVDHRVNRELARERGIAVDYIPDYGTDSVAEMTLAGMLAVSRELLVSVRETKRGGWAYELLKNGKRVPTIEEIPQRVLKGKTVGLVGFGRIGQRVAELCHAFGTNILYWSRHAHPQISFPATLCELQDLFSTADIVSVHLSPYAPAHLVSRALLARLKNGAIFVNTSAGRLVDQVALWDELKAGRITAYIDVYETLPPRKIISELAGRNVFTYRSGWFTKEAVSYKGAALIENVRRYLEQNG